MVTPAVDPNVLRNVAGEDISALCGNIPTYWVLETTPDTPRTYILQYRLCWIEKSCCGEGRYRLLLVVVVVVAPNIALYMGTRTCTLADVASVHVQVDY